MEKKDNIYTIIKSSNDISYLIDLFYEQINTKEPLDSLPVCIKIANRIKSLKEKYTDDEQLVLLELNNLYIFCMSEINRILFHLKYESNTGLTPSEIDNKLYLGFEIISKKEKQDKDVKDFIARRMVKDMFNNTFPNHRFNIEEELHTRFNSKNKIEENGIKKSMVDIISTHDPYLSGYVMCNISVLDEVKDNINNMIDNYDKFEEKNEENRYKYLIDEVTDFCEDKGMNIDENLFRVAEEYLVLNNVIKYSEKYDLTDYNKIREMVISASRDEIDFNYICLRKIVEKYLNTRYIYNKLSESDDKLKISLDNYLLDFDNMSEEDSLKKAEEILKNIKTNEEYDYAIDYLTNSRNKKTKKLINFIKKGDYSK
ncbi:MAG: hypothetical protein J6O56_02660 [Bacilli bacterium]|nr:hypothetical protein [Bacilli bacterium]